ncbi:MAG: phosphatidylserine/phosphatidylglycerophosphate/cardiolipin synthase family protein [Bdellovibrionales bacterium]|nr:phosphatidylserine/phosphatidylglycerophosphate/cardiolipin synthase family protein [Bdellovibrionales bacterium]
MGCARAATALVVALSQSALAGHPLAIPTAATAPPIRMISEGRELHAARLELIKGARSSIYLTAYHISDDASSTEIVEALRARAREGLEVRVMVERQGSPRFRRSVRRLRASGAFVIFHRPQVLNMVYALHEKLLIADGTRVLLGGSGYQGWYAHANRFAHYDMDFVVSGEVACRFHQAFQRSYAERAGLDSSGVEGWLVPHGLSRFRPCAAAPAAPPLPEPPAPAARALELWGDPLQSEARPILAFHLNAIAHARRSEDRRIRLYAPYFVPHPALIHALTEALKSGVRVQVITNSVKTNDERLRVPIVLAMKSAVRPLREAGAEIHLWNNAGTMHRKGGLLGDSLAYFGSDNFDNRGQEYSSETVLYTDESALIERMGSEFDEDLTHTFPMTDAYVDIYERDAGLLQIFLSRLIKPHI